MVPVRRRAAGSRPVGAHGGYVVPLKDAVRRAEGLELDDVVTVRLTVDV